MANQPKARVHVVPRSDGWAVRKEGAERASKVYKTKNDAIAGARTIGRNQSKDVVIHNKDGTIKNWDQRK